jgi:lysophospholipase L1-like esterase
MTPDGVHPNAAGARVLAANILPHLRPLATAGAVVSATR